MRPCKNLFFRVGQIWRLNIGYSPLWLARTVSQAIEVLPSVCNDRPVLRMYCEVQRFEAVLLDEVVNDLQDTVKRRRLRKPSTALTSQPIIFHS
jgi:hypothetical protein